MTVNSIRICTYIYIYIAAIGHIQKQQAVLSTAASGNNRSGNEQLHFIVNKDQLLCIHRQHMFAIYIHVLSNFNLWA